MTLPSGVSSSSAAATTVTARAVETRVTTSAIHLRLIAVRLLVGGTERRTGGTPWRVAAAARRPAGRGGVCPNQDREGGRAGQADWAGPLRPDPRRPSPPG